MGHNFELRTLKNRFHEIDVAFIVLYFLYYIGIAYKLNEIATLTQDNLLSTAQQ